MSRIITVLGVITSIVFAAAPELVNLNPTLARYLMLIGVAASAAGRELVTPSAFTNKTFQTIAFFLCLTVVSASTVACDPPKPPSRAVLEQLAQGGRTAGNVLEANETLPDQLLTAGAIKQDLHDQLVTALSAARADAKIFNDGMEEVLKSEKPDLKPLLPVALRLVQRIHALNRNNIPGWNQVFALAEVGIRVIATYFAIRVGDLRHAGLTDRQICAAVGVQYDPHLFELIQHYSNTPESEEQDGSPAAGE